MFKLNRKQKDFLAMQMCYILDSLSETEEDMDNHLFACLNDLTDSEIDNIKKFILNGTPDDYNGVYED